MLSKEQKAHDLAVALAGNYTADELARGEYKDSDVYKSMVSDAVSVYERFYNLLLEEKEL